MHQVLQNVSLITKCDWMLLQKASVIIKCDRLLLQRASVITRCENNYKVRDENILFICCNTIFACVYQVTENLARAGICFQSNFYIFTLLIIIFRNSHSEVFLRKGVLKLCSKFTGEHPRRSAIYWNRTSAWLFCCKFVACFQNIFPRNTSGWLLLYIISMFDM